MSKVGSTWDRKVEACQEVSEGPEDFVVCMNGSD